MAFPREVIVQYQCRCRGKRDYGVVFTDASRPSPVLIGCACGEQCIGEICSSPPRQANPDGLRLENS